MGDKREWTKGEIEDLITMYRGKPELWDVKSTRYKDKELKQETLKEFSEAFYTTVEEIQRKIHNLRNQYNSELKKAHRIKANRGGGELPASKWPYFDMMRFIHEGLKSRKYNLPKVRPPAVEVAINENSTTSENLSTSWDPYEEPPDEPDFTHFLHQNNTDVTRKRKPDPMNNDSLVEKSIRMLNDGEDDQYEVFGKYVASEMRNLPSEYLRKKMKMRFLQVILEINEESELM